MKHMQRVLALFVTMIILVGCLTTGVAFADGGTKVNIRLVLNLAFYQFLKYKDEHLYLF